MAKEPEKTGRKGPIATTTDEGKAQFKKLWGYFPEDETPSQAFQRIAPRRMGATLEELRKLESLADKANYEYTEAHVEKMLKALQDGCQKVADRFAGKVKGKESFQF